MLTYLRCRRRIKLGFMKFSKFISNQGGCTMDTLALPSVLSREASTCWHKDQLWFDAEPPDRQLLDFDREEAFMAEGIGKRECPTVGAWVSFSLVGALAAALTGRYIYPPNSEPFNWAGEVEHHAWEALWRAVQENGGALDRAFIAAMLRRFLPRQHHAPPEHPYYESMFLYGWDSSTCMNTSLKSVGTLLPECVARGQKALETLPQNEVDSIRSVALHVPRMLEITLARIRRTYWW